MDIAEGPTYNRLTDVGIETGSGRHNCTTYQVRISENGLEPFDWHLALILAGCLEHNLPAHVSDWYKAHSFTADPDKARPGRTLAIQTMKRSGVLDLMSETLGMVKSLSSQQ